MDLISRGPPIPWVIPGGTLRPAAIPLLMGIVNVTPDSFSDGGQFADVDAAVAHGLQLVADGADILDVGGESTRPYSAPVSEEEELSRIVPVVRALAKQAGVPISIDTTKATVARAGMEAGAAIINDISGLTFDPAMIETCRATGAGVVCMHIQGTPQTMQDAPIYDDVVSDVCLWLRRRLDVLVSGGMPLDRICLDPGVGFGKTPAHNLALLSNLDRLHELGRPLLIGHSRKRFIGKLLGRKIDERESGTVGIAIAVAQQKAEIIRVHDVRAVRDALLAWHTVAAAIPDDVIPF